MRLVFLLFFLRDVKSSKMYTDVERERIGAAIVYEHVKCVSIGMELVKRFNKDEYNMWEQFFFLVQSCMSMISKNSILQYYFNSNYFYTL